MKKNRENKVQAEYFDREVAYFSNMHSESNPHQDQVIEHFLGMLGSKVPGKEILELGCGTGMYTIPLLEAGYRVTGVDVSRASLDVCVARAEEKKLSHALTVVCSSIEELDYRDAFHGVVGKHIIHHVEDIEAVAEICYNALKPEGISFFMEPNPICPMWIAYITADRKRRWDVEKGILSCFPHQLKRAFSGAAFSRFDTSYYGLIPAGVVRALPRLGRLNVFLDSVPFFRRLLALQSIVARK